MKIKMPKTSLYEGTIAQKAKKFSKKFPEHIRSHAQITIEHLLEAGRDLALVDGKVIEQHEKFPVSVWVDTIRYRSEFERNTETISMYCEFAAETDKPLTALKLLSENDYLPVIRLPALREAIKAKPSNIEELRKKIEELKRNYSQGLERLTRRAEEIERIESNKKYETGGIYKRTPYDSRPDYEAKVKFR